MTKLVFSVRIKVYLKMYIYYYHFIFTEIKLSIRSSFLNCIKNIQPQNKITYQKEIILNVCIDS